MMPLAGVEVQAWSGPEAYTVSDSEGEFAFTGHFVGSDVFAALKDGYVTQRRTVDAGLDFVLEPLATTTQPAGQR